MDHAAGSPILFFGEFGLASELERLFQEMVDLTAEERERRLESLSVPEPLRRELRELIEYDRADSHTLEKAVGNIAAEALSTDHWTGATAGAYRLDRLLGHGGMGAVYLGKRSDGVVKHQAAIKLIHSRAPGLIERFLCERQILASLSHPHIAELLDAGEIAGGVPYFAMEYCDGEAIDTYCKHQNLDTRAILELFLPICSAVHYAHQRMIIHRDLKPSNILVSSSCGPKLLDFGIAKILDDPAIEPTQTGARLLTLQFASPEQIRGEMVSAASDVYSLGAVLYLLLTGHYIRETTSASFAPAILDADIIRPRIWQPLLPSDIENIGMTALRREPEARYSSAEALAEDLRRFRRFFQSKQLHPVSATALDDFFGGIRSRRSSQPLPLSPCLAPLHSRSIRRGRQPGIYPTCAKWPT